MLYDAAGREIQPRPCPTSSAVAEVVEQQRQFMAAFFARGEQVTAKLVSDLRVERLNRVCRDLGGED